MDNSDELDETSLLARLGALESWWNCEIAKEFRTALAEKQDGILKQILNVTPDGIRTALLREQAIGALTGLRELSTLVTNEIDGLKAQLQIR